jgi:hypothetical protein
MEVQRSAILESAWGFNVYLGTFKLSEEASRVLHQYRGAL